MTLRNDGPSPGSSRWQYGVAFALLCVVVVDIAFAWVATRASDPVDPTYTAASR